MTDSSAPNLRVAVLPAADIDNFEQAITYEETHIPTLLAEYRQQLIKVEADRATSLEVFRQQLASHDADVEVDASGFLAGLDADGWSYDSAIDQNVRLENGKLTTPRCICVTLNAKRFENVIPSAFRMNDNALDVQYQNGRVTIRNNTRNYVTVDALTVYYGRDVNTKGGANFQNYHEIAPGATAEIYGVDGQVDSSEASFTVSRAEAAKTNIRFGLAVKYRMTHDTTPRSLFQTKDYSLLSLIER